jgi:5-methylcytosine-specific restriction endonuclease McrA
MRLGPATGVEYDHDNPDALTGEPTLENCRVLCAGCHKHKTKTDRARITKAHRLARKAAGITARKAKIPGSKGTGWRRPLNGPAYRVEE